MRSPRMFGAIRSRIALSCSFILVAGSLLAGEYSQLDAKLRATPSVSEKWVILTDHEATSPPMIQDRELGRLIERAQPSSSASVSRVESYIHLKAMVEAGAGTGDQAAEIANIKSNPIYPRDRRDEDANWLSAAIERLRNLRGNSRAPTPRAPGSNIFALSQFVVYVVWGLIIGLIVAFLVYATRFVHFRNLRHRKARALLQDDEPERSLDEWLAMADDLERQGRFREAVRALYLASLLKFDERNIAAFVRGQTNWEHLARIEASPRLPEGLDFRPPTHAFDQIWYGGRLRGVEDVARFRGWYTEIAERVRGARP